ncbi:hypothetical protein PG997_008046 [Apiospora hydei]|uniref:Cyanovirin-N domain-containing protein n=1 Tax=Apiospora hydei TaxID=1337664 RepID=A0ABR1W9T7_9PEZI
MVIRKLYEPGMADSDSPPQQGGEKQKKPEYYGSPLPRIPTNPGSPRIHPMSSGSITEDKPADYPYSPDQLSYPSYVRGHSYQQPAPAPVPSSYGYAGLPTQPTSPSYATQQYPQQPTYAETPAAQPAYSPQPVYSPQPAYPPQPVYSPQPPQSPQPPSQYPSQPEYASPPAPPPYSSSVYGDIPGDFKQEKPAADGSMPPTADEERGLMGAMLGGATGAFAGHKVNHGFLGALGGAYAGHRLEEAWKDQKQNSRPTSSSSQQQHQPPPPMMMAPPQPQYAAVPVLAPAPVFAPAPARSPSPKPEPPQFGNFSLSSWRISIDGDYDLIADCRTISGQQRLSSISLNRYLTNMDGHFRWSGEEHGNFGASARNVRLVEDGRFLEAELRTMDGTWRWDRIHLDERIMNIDGDLQLN